MKSMLLWCCACPIAAWAPAAGPGLRLGQRAVGAAQPRMVAPLPELASHGVAAADALASHGHGLAAGPTAALAFADQQGKLAGTFFQASLLPYVGFLYFLGYKPNNTPKVAYFGFQFLLLFVLSTVFTGIVTKSVYASSLADVDWLHGAAEALLTTTNLYVGLGFRAAMAGDPPPEGGAFRYPALAVFALVVLATAAGPSLLGLEQHSAFLGGLGNLGSNPLAELLPNLPAEPANALSVPTWAIHFSSVFEWLFAMGMVWKYAEASGNPKWRALTWGMLPLHASGVAACTYHFFYNSAEVGSLVALQAGLTLLGNTTVCIAAILIALSNGWTLQEPLDALKALSPLSPKESEPAEGRAEEPAPAALRPVEVPPAPLLGAELVLLTAVCSLAIKCRVGEHLSVSSVWRVTRRAPLPCPGTVSPRWASPSTLTRCSAGLSASSSPPPSPTAS